MKFVLTTLLVVAMSSFGCGGGEKGADSGADAEVDLTPIEELQALSTNLKAGVEGLMSPINGIDELIEQVTSMPARLSIDAPALMGMVKGTMESGQVAISADLDVTAEAKAEIEALLVGVQTIIADLKATPDKVKTLGGQLAEATAKLPILATKVTTKAQAKLANPMGNAEGKVQAQADLDALVGVQAEVTASIEEVKATITGIPAMAVEALAKLTASFSGSV